MFNFCIDTPGPCWVQTVKSLSTSRTPTNRNVGTVHTFTLVSTSLLGNAHLSTMATFSCPQGAFVERFNSTFFWFAAYNGHTDCLRLLLQYSQIEVAIDCTDAEERLVVGSFSSFCLKLKKLTVRDNSSKVANIGVWIKTKKKYALGLFTQILALTFKYGSRSSIHLFISVAQIQLIK